MNKRLIVLNTIVSYLRSFLVAGMTLFSTRWVLGALGKRDLGLYYVIGGVVVFLTFINTSMAFSAQRHFAYALGKGGTQEIRKWFNSSLALHFVLSGIFVILSVPLCFFAFKYWLAIPEGRTTACYWVFVCSVLTAVASILSVPYNAIYIARQHIYELSVIQFGNALLSLGLAAWLRYYTGDRLIAYACGLLIISVSMAAAQIIRCQFAFPESTLKFSLMKSRERYKELLSFSGWSLTSTLAYILRGQVVALLLNNYGTSGCNAAYGIANHVSGQTGFLANGFMSAISPELTKMEGEGRRNEMIQYATKACKFVMFMILFMSLPLLTDIEPLLDLWLENVPEGTATFFRIVLWAFLAVQSVLGVTVASKAIGKIALPEIWAAVALLLAIPMAYISVMIGLPMSFVVASVAVTACLCSISTLMCARSIFGYSISIWVREVFIRNAVTVIVVLVFNHIVHVYMAVGLPRLCVVTAIDWTILGLVGWRVILQADERAFILKKFKLIKDSWNGKIQTNSCNTYT